jgi:hypothetical protein
MKIFDTQKQIVDLKGLVIKDGEKELLLGDILANALSYSKENPARCYQLAKKFATETTVELKAEDVVFLKGIVEKAGMVSLTAGQILEELGE